MDPHPALTRVRSWLEDRADAMADLLEELVEAESPTTRPELQESAFQILGEAFARAGYESRRIEGRMTGGELLARPRRREKGRPFQVVIGHVDTVWPAGTLEEMPVRREDGRMTGPGVFDMKGGLAQLAFALLALHDLDLEPEVTPVIFLNSDEEIGSVESEDNIRRLARSACRALILEPGLDLEGKLKTARRGVGRFDVRVVGRSSHTGLAPQEGASAIQELSHVIQKLHAISDAKRGITVNVGQIQGGTRPNVVAAEATAVVDVRVSTREDGRWVEDRMRELSESPPVTPGTKVEIVGEVGRPPMERTPRNQELWEAARVVGRALGLELEQGTSGGASDGNITSEFTATLDGLGAVGDGAHATHEHVDVERMPERAALLAGVLLLPDLSGEPAFRGERREKKRRERAGASREPAEAPQELHEAPRESAEAHGDAVDARRDVVDTRPDVVDGRREGVEPGESVESGSVGAGRGRDRGGRP